MFNLARRYARGTCAHGYAGIASWFVALADRMAKNDGTMALVLPMTALQGSSWQKVRQLIASNYSDVIVMTIATAKQDDQSFSADTGMAETLLVCRKSKDEANGRGVFVSFNRRPRSEMEAILRISVSSDLNALETGPFGGYPITIGDELIAESIDAPLSSDLPWSAAGVSDLSLTQFVHQLVEGRVWLPQMPQPDPQPIPMSMVDDVCHIGPTDNNIVGNGSQTAFTLERTLSAAPTYPMLWGHNALRERRLIVAPDSEGRVKRGREPRAAQIWESRSHAHHNRDFRFNSQPLAVAFTQDRTIGGRAWPNVKFERREHEVAYSLWGNSTLGLVTYWWHSSRQQAGRGSMPVTAIRTMPTLDVTQLSDDQLQTVETIFEEIKNLDFLPANEAYRDDTRKRLDRHVLIDLLNLPESILEPLDLLRLKWCSEPSVHGGKGTAPDGV